MTNSIDQNGVDQSALTRLGLTPRAAEKPADQLGQEDFMRLMITQLRNQDPFKPMESGEFLGQLAQFGTVSGIDEVRQSLQSLADSLQGNQTLQAAGLVDQRVLVPSREAWLPPDGGVVGAVDVPAEMTGAAVGIYDLTGQLVDRITLAETAGGRHAFEWDGTLSDGTRAAPGFYELRATGMLGGETVALDALVSGRVESVGVGNGSLTLTVSGLGVVDFSTVRGIA